MISVLLDTIGMLGILISVAAKMRAIFPRHAREFDAIAQLASASLSSD